MSSEVVDGEGGKKGATTRCKKWLAGDELGRHLLSVLRHDRRGKIIKLCSHTFTLAFAIEMYELDGGGGRATHFPHLMATREFANKFGCTICH